MLREVPELWHEGRSYAASEAANNQVRLCVSKSKNGDWKSGFFTVEANVLFVLNLLELFVHWRSRKDDFSGLALPEAGQSAFFPVLRVRSSTVCSAGRYFSTRIPAWTSLPGSRSRCCRSR